MKRIAGEIGAEKVYTNGGSGLFLIHGDEKAAQEFGQRIQQEYGKETRGGASITLTVPSPVPSVFQSERVLPSLAMK